MEDRKIAIEVKHVDKTYKLYDHNRDRFLDALGVGSKKKKRYKEHKALNDVNINIYQGETVGIIGTNGSGKSTILKIITGVLNPTGGEVIVNGRISALLELGAGFNMEYNGIENIYLNGTMIGFSEAEIDQKLDAILEFADIGDYVYQPVKTYSSGMFVRLAFAVAINIDPEILIVDEALSVGDVFFQAKCYHKFEEFKKMGKTILFVSHDLSSIAKYCDRVVLLNQGVKLGEGKPKQMIDDYKRVLVGQYVDTEEENTVVEEIDEDLNTENVAEHAGEHITNADAGEKQAGTAQNKAGEAKAGDTEASRQEQIAAGVNPDLLEYGTKKAEIVEYYVTDEHGVRTTAVIKGSRFTIHMKVDMHEDVEAPIFAFTIKNIHGTEITGTNSMFEKTFLESVKKGTSKEITFTQDMNLQGGEYLLSLGCTGYEKDTFTVYHRLYDVINITVVSDKNTVGYYDMNSIVEVKDC